ncbi:MAG: flavin reductase family protein [Elusimicrobiota bacterium]
MFEPVALPKFHRLINHGPCVLVSCGDGARANAAPVQWNMPVNDDPPLAAVALESDNFTSELVMKTREFVLNVPEAGLLPAIGVLGRRSGRDGDKVKDAGLTWGEGVRVKAPHLRECLGFIECRVRDAHDYGGVRLVVGDVLYAAADPEKFREGRFLPGVRTVHHLGGLVFALTGERVGPQG